MEKPTFAERTAALKSIAENLRTFAETIMREAQHMEVAQSRFQQRVERRMSPRQPAKER